MATKKPRRRKVAALLLWRKMEGEVMVLLALPGGGAKRRPRRLWSIPKGRVDKGESWKAAARREFREELGKEAPRELVPLGRVKTERPLRTIRCYAAEGKFKPRKLKSGSLKWRGRLIPEIERVAWFNLADASRVLHPAQRPFLARLKKILGEGSS